MIIWNSKAKENQRNKDSWYGKYNTKTKIAVLSTKQFGINLIIKLSNNGTLFKPSLTPHNISIGMNGSLLLSHEQYKNLILTIAEGLNYISNLE